jgi:hypothetical protein
MVRWGVIVSIVFLFGAAIFTARGFQRPLIVVVQSYGDNIPWTRGTNAGLHRELDNAKDVRVRWLYLDANHPRREGHAPSTIERANAVIKSVRPQAIIAMDDVAQQQVANPLLGHYPRWLIFGGIQAADRNLQRSNVKAVAGVDERTPWRAVQTLLSQFAQQKGLVHPRVGLINDASSAGDEEAAGFEAHAWQGMQVAGLWRCKDVAEWRAALSAMHGLVDLVVIGDYRTMPFAPGMDRLLGRQDIVRMTLAAVPAPVVALSGYAVDDGVPVGILPSPLEQGEEAARLALAAVRSGITPYRYQESREFILHINGAALAARGLVVPELYASFARQVGALFHPDKD